MAAIMIDINVSVDVKRAIRGLTDIKLNQVPFATSLAINRTAQDVQAKLAEATSAFDRPKPLTKKGTYIERSTKANLTAKVALKTRGKGGPVEEYLAAEITGGARADKRSETLLKNAGLLPPGYQTRPGSGARLDAYGNMSRGQIVQILSYFRAFGSITESGRNRKKQSRSAMINRGKTIAANKYFVVAEGYPGLATGIWMRKGAGGKSVEPILIFIKDASYRKRYDFQGVARKTVSDRFVKRFDEAMAIALASARA